MSVIPSRARPALLRAARLADDGYGATAQPDWREVNWRSHLHSIDIDGGHVNFVDIGSGEDRPVVFVHGLGGAWQNWLENIPRAAQERRVIAVDLPGFGQSEMPLEQISIQGYGRFIEKFCDRLGLGEVVMVGNSMGGFITAEVAIQHPERVERLVLCPPVVPGWEWSERVRRAWQEEDEALEAGDLDRATEVNLELWVDGPTEGAAHVVALERPQEFNAALLAFLEDPPT